MDADADSDKDETIGFQGELAECLDQLQSLSAELDSVRPLGMHARNDTNSGASKMISASTPSINVLQASNKLSKPPPVPPKPPLDSYRYSMANMEESADIDLDALLGELYALETQLNNGGTDDSWMGLTKNSAVTITPRNTSIGSKRPTTTNTVTSSLVPPSVPAKPSMKHHQPGTTISPSRADHPTTLSNDVMVPFGGGNNCLAECGTKAQSSGESSSFCNVNRAQSPDNDSAFCDSSSMMSSESMQSSSGLNMGLAVNNANAGVPTIMNNARRVSGANVIIEEARNGLNTAQRHTETRHSNGSSVHTMLDNSRRCSVAAASCTSQTVEPVQLQIQTIEQEIKKENFSEDEKNARIKAEKIRLALQKMKEASVKKLYVKIFSPNGSSKSILVDERWTVACALRQLAEKHLVALTPSHALVEYMPDLFMERIYEDHEYLVENLLLWTRDSPNKLYFVDRPDKYHLFKEPQFYLLDALNAAKCADMNPEKKQQLIDEFFSLSHVQPPEIEGALYLKADGKKSWKKHHFVLRASGLYYVPKGRIKGSKDLVCLMNLEMIQVYNGLGWKRKYKAPTDFGFALKHPQIQVKASSYIKYLCAEDEKTHHRWMTGLRIAKNGRALLDNYHTIFESTGTETMEITKPTQSNDDRASYYKESVVMRPSKGAGLGVELPLMPSVSSPRPIRPRSADITRASQKRNSRTLTHVNIPALPTSESSVSNLEHVPESSGSRLLNNHAGEKTPTPDSQSLTGFESDFTTGTIKRQPTGGGGGGITPSKILPGYPLTAAQNHGARLPLTDSTKHIHLAAVARKHSAENGLSPTGNTSPSLNATNGRSGSSRTLNEENDSDEELPVPVQARLTCRPASCSPTPASDVEFAPPPSPLPQAVSPSTSSLGAPRTSGSPSSSSLGAPRTASPSTSSLGASYPRQLEVKITENGSSASSSTISNDLASCSTLSNFSVGRSPVPPIIVNGVEKGEGQLVQSTGQSILPEVQPVPSPGSRSDHGQKVSKKVPPTPPKRAENTRLSIGHAENARLSIDQAENTRLSVGQAPPPTKPKPALPAKPKLLPANGGGNAISPSNGSVGNPVSPVSPSHRSSINRPPSTDENLSNAFQNELQRAMQKRLQKMEAGTADQGSKSTS